jgi:bifunctional DNA-binding transcriptional regulator/antitoxin component of YhaV-PrlF toxin-antitoxin module
MRRANETNHVSPAIAQANARFATCVTSSNDVAGAPVKITGCECPHVRKLICRGTGLKCTSQFMFLRVPKAKVLGTIVQRGPARARIDFRFSVKQFFCMPTAIQISPRGTITLPISLRRRLKLDRKDHSVLLVEERPDGIFLHPAITVPVRAIPVSTIKKWVRDDEADAARVKVLKR